MERLYSIYDRVAGAVEGPVVALRHDGPAIRMFHDLLAAPQTSPGQHPGDYELLFVGTREPSGELTPVIPVVVATGASWAETRKPEGANAGS